MIAFTPTNGWVLLFDAAGVYIGDVPDDLGKLLNAAVASTPGPCRACSPLCGDWFVLVGDGMEANVPDQSSGQAASQLRK